jgi:ribosomal protein L30E
MSKEKGVAIVMCAAGLDGSDQAATGTGVTTTAANLGPYEFTLGNKPLEVGGTVAITDSVEIFTNNGDGTLTGSAGGTGTIDYVTGEVSVTFNAMVAANPITAAYEYYANVADTVYLFSSSTTSTAFGSVTKTLTIPSLAVMDKGPYSIIAYKGDGTTVTEAFSVGAVVKLTKDEGPTGTVVEITGEGFDDVTPDNIEYGDIWITDGANTENCYIIDEPVAGVDVDAQGKFKL